MIVEPIVKIDNEVFRKIMHWVNKSQYEVSGLGTVILEGDNTFRVTQAMLLPQKNGQTHTDIEAEDVGKLMFAMKDEPGDLRFWWHSHVDMDVFWSGTDMDTIKKIGQGGWFLSTVFNKAREMRSAYYGVSGQTTPFGVAPLFLDELTTTVDNYADDKTAEWDAQYTKMVTNQVPVRTIYPGYDFQDDLQVSHLPRIHSTPTAQPARPPGMSRREWKKFRKTQAPAIINPIEAVDEYGFTQEERSYFARAGWDQSDLDDLSEEDVTPIEMLALVNTGLTVAAILSYVRHQGWSAEDIIEAYEQTTDSPVMDQSQGGKYDTQ